MRFILFQFIATLFFLGIQVYLFRTFFRATAEKLAFKGVRRGVGAAFILFSLPLLIGVVLRLLGLRTPGWAIVHVLPPLYLWHFVSLLLFLLLMFGKLLKLPFLSIGWILGKFDATRPFVRSVSESDRVRRFNVRRRQVIRHSLAAVTGVVAVGSAYEIYRRETFDTNVIRMPVKGLPPAFHGFSIGFTSDIHSGIFMSGERMRSYAEAINGLGADMIVVTGDFVNSQLDEVHPLTEAFGILHAPEGVFGVLGNHDFYTRRVDEVAREIDRCGVTLLRDRHLEITRNGEAIHLAGIDDTGNPGLAGTLFRRVAGGSARAIPRILLCHRPYFFPDAAAAGFDLVLAGHTHGGQVVLGEMGKDVLAPARLVSPYVAGVYSEGTSRMYVSRGIGTVGVPFRFNCPPEITKIVLETGPA